MEKVVLEQYGANAAGDILLCHEVSNILNKHYPNHPWLVGADHEAGTVNVQLAYLDKFGRLFRYGLLLHINKLQSDEDLKKKVMRAGGEMLERWNLTRDAATPESWHMAKSNGLITEGAI